MIIDFKNFITSATLIIMIVISFISIKNISYLLPAYVYFIILIMCLIYYLLSLSINNFHQMIIIISAIKILLIANYYEPYLFGDSYRYVRFMYWLDNGMISWETGAIKDHMIDNVAISLYTGGIYGWIVPSIGTSYFIISKLIGISIPENFNVSYVIHYVIFNQIFITLGCLYWIKLLGEKNKLNWAIIFLSFSHEAIFYSNWLGKESILFFLTPLLTYLIYKNKKNWVLILLLVIYGSLLRPYFIALIVCTLIFLGYFKRKQIYLILCTAVVIALSWILLLGIKNISNISVILYYIRNVLHDLIVMLFSPNWLRTVNWSGYTFMTLFSASFSILFIFVVFSDFKIFIKKYSRLLFSYGFYAIVTALVTISSEVFILDTTVFGTWTTRQLFPIIALKYIVLFSVLFLLKKSLGKLIIVLVKLEHNRS